MPNPARPIPHAPAHNASSLAMTLALLLAPCTAAAGVKPPDYDFEWAVIGDPGNEPYDGRFAADLGTTLTAGRGGVDYAYRMSVLEVTTGQWMEFVNTFAPQSQNPSLFPRPSLWGAVYAGGGRYVLNPALPDAANAPAIGVSWRDAAMFCNWLHNDKSTDPAAMLSGAYDVSTFGKDEDGFYTDQRTHSSGAKFWIPTLDEWLKAAHYDPDRYGDGEGGWWRFPTTSDSVPIPGLPGVGQTTGGLEVYPPGVDPWDIPLGAYPETRSPWGLLDTSGGGGEWVEEVANAELNRFEARVFDGSWAGAYDFFAMVEDHIDVYSGIAPYHGGGIVSLRIASSIPSASAFSLVLVSLVYSQRRRVK